MYLKSLQKVNISKKLIVISQALKDIYLESGYLGNDKIQVEHDGADEVKDFNSKIKLLGKENSLKVGYVGHLYRGRGIDLIIDCAKLMRDVTFHIVGGTNKDLDKWKNLIKQINLPNIFLWFCVSQKFHKL